MRKQLIDRTKWHRKFAWLPVITKDGQRVWLEWVEQRCWGMSWWDDYYEFRLPPTLSQHKRGGA